MFGLIPAHAGYRLHDGEFQWVRGILNRCLLPFATTTTTVSNVIIQRIQIRRNRKSYDHEIFSSSHLQSRVKWKWSVLLLHARATVLQTSIQSFLQNSLTLRPSSSKNWDTISNGVITDDMNFWIIHAKPHVIFSSSVSQFQEGGYSRSNFPFFATLEAVVLIMSICLGEKWECYNLAHNVRSFYIYGSLNV